MKSKCASVAKVVALAVVPAGLAGVVTKVARDKATRQLFQCLSVNLNLARGGYPVDGEVDALVAQGAGINARDSYSLTPLHYAACYTSTGLRCLLDRGALVDAQDPSGATPIMLAVMMGNSSNVRLLLSRGADPNLRMRKNGKALTPLFAARNGLSWDRYPEQRPDPIIMRREIIPALQAAGAKE